MHTTRFSGNGAEDLDDGNESKYGMGNTMPFGCPEQVRDFLQIQNLIVEQPEMNHPKRTVIA